MTLPGSRIFVCLLASLAGYVDAIGFIRSGGFFVSFMSGNSTRLGVGIVNRLQDGLIACGLVASFVAGVVLGALAGQTVGRYRAPTVLACVAALLAPAAFLDNAGHIVPALGLLALAMGAVNTVFERRGEVRIGITYVTGGLVQAGAAIASAMLRRGKRAWGIYLLLWLAFVTGTIVGALAYGQPPNFALAAAALAAVFLAVLSLRPGLSSGLELPSYSPPSGSPE